MPSEQSETRTMNGAFPRAGTLAFVGAIALGASVVLALLDRPDSQIVWSFRFGVWLMLFSVLDVVVTRYWLAGDPQ